MPDSPKLTLTKSDSLDDWYLIERAEHDGRVWLEQHEDYSAFQCGSRISDADVEGYGDEMLAIALAIRQRGRVSFKRCAVRVDGERVFFRSPRNSQREGETSLEEADALAELIERTLKSEPQSSGGSGTT